MKRKNEITYRNEIAPMAALGEATTGRSQSETIILVETIIAFRGEKATLLRAYNELVMGIIIPAMHRCRGSTKGNSKA